MAILPLASWPRKRVEGVTPLLQPVAHTLLQVKEELPDLLAGLSDLQLWAEPAGVPPIGYQVAHLAGNIERLFTHARGRALSAHQLQAMAEEGAVASLRPTLGDLLGRLDLVLEDALAQLRTVTPERLLETCDLGSDGTFATVMDLLSSAAEHASRHLGEIVTTTAIVRGLNGA
jgi:hypothetical protein